mmetsp:Transcript_35522/g.41110  ORF Transcript_35522/g.41110 Transcript_35522/m.41110 type:complete len:136 (+) Transcript_35522:1112-1519(+)
MQKDLLDYWGYDEERKTDYLFIQANVHKAATLINRFTQVPLRFKFQKIHLEIDFFDCTLKIPEHLDLENFDTVSLTFKKNTESFTKTFKETEINNIFSSNLTEVHFLSVMTEYEVNEVAEFLKNNNDTIQKLSIG